MDQTFPAQPSTTPVPASAIAHLHLPRMTKFAGEKIDNDESLDQFIREFERHASLAGWTGDVKRLQFEVHLTGRALRMYESLPAEKRLDYNSARDALREQLQPVKLDSFKRSQFNSRRQQPGETVSDFAQDIQRLMDKAYACHSLEPSLRDKILLGQLEQGLLTKWKHHLRYLLDTFQDALYIRPEWLKLWMRSC